MNWDEWVVEPSEPKVPPNREEAEELTASCGRFLHELVRCIPVQGKRSPLWHESFPRKQMALSRVYPAAYSLEWEFSYYDWSPAFYNALRSELLWFRNALEKLLARWGWSSFRRYQPEIGEYWSREEAEELEAEYGKSRFILADFDEMPAIDPETLDALGAAWGRADEIVRQGRVVREELDSIGTPEPPSLPSPPKAILAIGCNKPEPPLFPHLTRGELKLLKAIRDSLESCGATHASQPELASHLGEKQANYSMIDRLREKGYLGNERNRGYYLTSLAMDYFRIHGESPTNRLANHL